MLFIKDLAVFIEPPTNFCVARTAYRCHLQVSQTSKIDMYDASFHKIVSIIAKTCQADFTFKSPAYAMGYHQWNCKLTTSCVAGAGMRSITS